MKYYGLRRFANKETLGFITLYDDIFKGDFMFVSANEVNNVWLVNDKQAALKALKSKPYGWHRTYSTPGWSDLQQMEYEVFEVEI